MVFCGAGFIVFVIVVVRGGGGGGGGGGEVGSIYYVKMLATIYVCD